MSERNALQHPDSHDKAHDRNDALSQEFVRIEPATSTNLAKRDQFQHIPVNPHVNTRFEIVGQ